MRFSFHRPARAARRQKSHGAARSAALLVAVHAAGVTGLASSAAAQGPEDLTIDGSFEDWDRLRADSITDPIDAPPNAAIDIGRIAWHATGEHLYLQLDVRRTVNLQQLDGRLHLLIDSDGRTDSGAEKYGMEGVDAIVTFSPKAQGWRDGMGVGLAVTGDESRNDLGPYDAGVLFSPTYASDEYEIRIDRGAPLPETPGFLEGNRCRLKLVLTSKALEVQDETETFTVRMPNATGPWRPNDREQQSDPIAKTNPSAIRVVVWNGERGALLKRKEQSQKILRALKPDIVLLQELEGGTNVEELDALFEGLSMAGTGTKGQWRIIFGEGGGNLRCAVATRAAVERDLFPEPVGYDDASNHTMRFAGGVLDFGGRKLLATAVHLKCCGKIGDESDYKRRRETARLRDIIDQQVATGRIDGVIVGGDFNLVGGYAPLAIAKAGVDLDGTDLEVADVVQLDRRTNATWEGPGEPFIPGRLDYLLFSDASLRIVKGFVFDARDLSPHWILEHGLEPTDTAEASDHLPLVVDVLWRQK